LWLLNLLTLLAVVEITLCSFNSVFRDAYLCAAQFLTDKITGRQNYWLSSTGQPNFGSDFGVSTKIGRKLSFSVVSIESTAASSGCGLISSGSALMIETALFAFYHMYAKVVHRSYSPIMLLLVN